MVLKVGYVEYVFDDMSLTCVPTYPNETEQYISTASVSVVGYISLDKSIDSSNTTTSFTIAVTSR